MAKRLNPNLYPFRWFAEALVERGMSISAAADKIGVTYSTVYNWLTGCYLKDAITKPDIKDDVARKIAEILSDEDEVTEIEVEKVRDHILRFLKEHGKIPSNHVVINFRSEVANFVEKFKHIHYYDDETALTPEKRELIYAALALLEKI